MSVWEDCPTIEAIPGKCAGQWVFAETRMPVYMLFGHLAAGGGLDEFCADFGMNGAEREKVNGLLEHLYRVLEEEQLPGPYLNDLMQSEEVASPETKSSHRGC